MPRVGEQVTVTFAPRGRYRACSSTPGRGTTSNRGCANALARAAVLSCLTCATSTSVATGHPVATPQESMHSRPETADRAQRDRQTTGTAVPGRPDRSRRRFPSPQALCPLGTAAPPPDAGVVQQRLRRMGAPRSRRPGVNQTKLPETTLGWRAGHSYAVATSARRQMRLVSGVRHSDRADDRTPHRR